MVVNQAYLFMIFTIVGMIIGLIFDLFRILRKTFKTKDVITNVEDILFWVISGLIVFYFMCNFSNGELRAYMILGIIIGFLMYLITLSKYVIKFSVRILNFIYNVIIERILLNPIKLCVKIIKTISLEPIIMCIKVKLKNDKKVIKIKGKNRGFFAKK